MWSGQSAPVGSADFHMSKRRERVAPFVVSLVCGLAAWILCLALGAPLDFVAPVLALLLQTLAAVLDHAVLADQRPYGRHCQPGDLCLPGDGTGGRCLLIGSFRWWPGLAFIWAGTPCPDGRRRLRRSRPASRCCSPCTAWFGRRDAAGARRGLQARGPSTAARLGGRSAGR